MAMIFPYTDACGNSHPQCYMWVAFMQLDFHYGGSRGLMLEAFKDVNAFAQGFKPIEQIAVDLTNVHDPIFSIADLYVWLQKHTAFQMANGTVDLSESVLAPDPWVLQAMLEAAAEAAESSSSSGHDGDGDADDA